MSFSAFFAGLAGLQANGNRLSVVGNNLANVNTVGFKSSRVTFQDIFSSVGGGFNGAGNPMQVGRGTQIAAIDPIFAQGSLQSTQVLTDLSIQGKGFFVLADAQGARSYSRAGNFTFDSDGFLVSPGGRIVQGYVTPDTNGNIPTSGATEDVQIPSGLVAPPNATGEFNAYVNLNATAAPLPATADEFPTSVAIYDTLGGRHILNLLFSPVDTDGNGTTDEWSYDITVAGDEVVGGTPGTPFSLQSGTVQFDANGQLIVPAGDVAVSVPGWTNGAAAQTINWQLYDDNGNGILTGFEGISSISSSNQDGYGQGLLRTLTIEPDGLISGLFTNGASLQLARVVLATFNNENGLLRDGSNGYLETNTAGLATVGPPNSGGRGILTSNTLELSNVDITQEFTDLIISQRGYQANSRIITTTDEIIQEALSLKR